MATGVINNPVFFQSHESVSITATTSTNTLWKVNPKVPSDYTIISVFLTHGHSAEVLLDAEIVSNSEISGYAKSYTNGSRTISVTVVTTAVLSNKVDVLNELS